MQARTMCRSRRSRRRSFRCCFFASLHNRFMMARCSSQMRCMASPRAGQYPTTWRKSSKKVIKRSRAMSRCCAWSSFTNAAMCSSVFTCHSRSCSTSSRVVLRGAHTHTRTHTHARLAWHQNEAHARYVRWPVAWPGAHSPRLLVIVPQGASRGLRVVRSHGAFHVPARTHKAMVLTGKQGQHLQAHEAPRHTTALHAHVVSLRNEGVRQEHGRGCGAPGAARACEGSALGLTAQVDLHLAHACKRRHSIRQHGAAVATHEAR